MPKIGLLATLLSASESYRSAGVHVYNQQLMQQLPQQAPQHQFVAYTGKGVISTAPHLTIRHTAFSVRRPEVRIAWEQLVMPRLAKKDRLDLLHGTVNALPIRLSIPTVVTVHDLSFLRFPEAFRPMNRIYLTRMVARSCRQAQRVIAVSKATAADIRSLLRIPAQKIEVIANGVDASFRPLPEAEIAEARQAEDWPRQFILMLGTLEPRKNHLMLLEAYARYRQLAARPLPLLIGGGKGWYYETIFERVQKLGLATHVRFLGFVPAAQLPALYNAASLFVYPSRFEGFGLPVVEAMACGTPAITSTASSLPEVAGDAALMISPDAPDELAQAMQQILDNPTRQQTMRTRGLTQAAQFSWQKTAARTAALYEQVLGDLNG